VELGTPVLFKVGGLELPKAVVRGREAFEEGRQAERPAQLFPLPGTAGQRKKIAQEVDTPF